MCCSYFVIDLLHMPIGILNADVVRILMLVSKYFYICNFRWLMKKISTALQKFELRTLQVES